MKVLAEDLLSIRKGATLFIIILWIAVTIVFGVFPALASEHWENFWVVLPPLAIPVLAIAAFWIGNPRFYELVARGLLTWAFISFIGMISCLMIVGFFFSGHVPVSDGGIGLFFGLMFSTYGGGLLGLIMFYAFAPKSEYPLLRFRRVP